MLKLSGLAVFVLFMLKPSVVASQGSLQTYGEITIVSESRRGDGWLCEVEFNQRIEKTGDLQGAYQQRSLIAEPHSDYHLALSSAGYTDQLTVYHEYEPGRFMFVGRSEVVAVQGRDAVLACPVGSSQSLVASIR